MITYNFSKDRILNCETLLTQNHEIINPKFHINSIYVNSV